MANHTSRHVSLIVALVVSAMTMGACTLDSAAPPALNGPSEFTLSIAVSASPEVLRQDGASQSVITATARDEAGRPVPNVELRWTGTASTSRALPVILSATDTLTDSSGRSSIVVTAPPTPTEAPADPDTLTISVAPRPVDGSFGSSAARSVMVRLQPPPGVMPVNNDPVPAFTANPAIGLFDQAVVFNAQATLDENEPCLGRCTYKWEFGDATTATGMIVSHAFKPPLAGDPEDAVTFTVTLTVIDDRGAVATLNQDFSVRPPALPVASFIVNPDEPAPGNGATFDASSSTVTAGIIVSYTWDFGDGTLVVTTGSPTVQHTFAAAGVYVVSLTVTDSGGRTHEAFQSVTVE
jgi:PKD repeat protein